ncbi:uncharacterized protein VTP21DRAFT_5131 [Calcarisporiella thermophila]|uniref:uncharacterized protein n=1 Tax=Calcarisporiella thermophila TaxID=911321 RepID=UPI003743F621
MKFAKQLESSVADIPSEWRQYVLPYRALKKVINAIVSELESRGLSSQVLREWLSSGTAGNDETLHHVEYLFSGNESDLHTQIKIMIEDDTYFQNVLEHIQLTPVEASSNSPSLILASDTTAKAFQPIECSQDTRNNQSIAELETVSGKQMLILEIKTDAEFFHMLLKEISNIQEMCESQRIEFSDRVNQLSLNMSKIASPYKKELYVWRRLLQLYQEEEIFVGEHEADHQERSWEVSQQLFNDFIEEARKQKLLSKLSRRDSQRVFEDFVRINYDIIHMKRLESLNQLAMEKILKKHDKRTHLRARQGFKKLISHNPYLTQTLVRQMCYNISSQLLTVIPQPSDYSCPICMQICWKPIRLNCNHVFCVRCLVKAQRMGHTDCPLCRGREMVAKADSSNLDTSMLNLLELYFPKEIRKKQKDLEKEQAIEDIEALTQLRWCDAHDLNFDCSIM